jgi:all-trans-retinol dehydrogenase (NAD+)
MKLAGSVAVVTGAGRGIGLATARRLAASGCAVALWDVDGAAVTAAAAGIAGRTFAAACDVTRAAEVYEAARRTRGALGDVDILVNNAGVVQGGPFLSRPDSDWEKLIAVNLTALLYTTRAFLEGMLARDRGHIVNISSAAGTLGVADLAVYAATKWAVWGFTESLRHEALGSGHRGVRFSSVHPSYVRTGIFEGARISGIGGFLVPQIREHDVVAAAVVETALRRGRRVVMRPRSVRLAPLLRGVLPAAVFDAVVRFFGIPSSMAGWQGGRPAS